MISYESSVVISNAFSDKELTLTSKGDHDVCSATVDSSESQRSEFGPNLQSFLNGILYLRLWHVGCVVHNPLV